MAIFQCWIWSKRQTSVDNDLKLFSKIPLKFLFNSSLTQQISYCNLPVEDHAVVIIKRQVSAEQSEQQHPHTPHISLDVTHHTAIFQLQVLQPGFHSSVAPSHAPANMIRTPWKSKIVQQAGNISLSGGKNLSIGVSMKTALDNVTPLFLKRHKKHISHLWTNVCFSLNELGSSVRRAATTCHKLITQTSLGETFTWKPDHTKCT